MSIILLAVWVISLGVAVLLGITDRMDSFVFLISIAIFVVSSFTLVMWIIGIWQPPPSSTSKLSAKGKIVGRWFSTGRGGTRYTIELLMADKSSMVLDTTKKQYLYAKKYTIVDFIYEGRNVAAIKKQDDENWVIDKFHIRNESQITNVAKRPIDKNPDIKKYNKIISRHKRNKNKKELNIMFHFIIGIIIILFSAILIYIIEQANINAIYFVAFMFVSCVAAHLYSTYRLHRLGCDNALHHLYTWPICSVSTIVMIAFVW